MKPGVATEFRKTCIQEYFSGQGKHVLCHLVSQGSPEMTNAIHNNMQYDVSEARSISRAFTEVETGIVSTDFADSN